MKTSQTNDFLISTNLSNNQQPLEWKRKSKSMFMLLAWRCSLVWVRLPGHVRKMKSLLLKFADRVAQTGRSVNPLSLRQLFRNKRHLIGALALGLGVVVYFAHHFLSDPYIEDHAICPLLGFQPGQCYNRVTDLGWCYMSWFYYWDTVNLFVSIILWSVAGFLLVPLNFGGVSVIAFSLFNAFGWVMFIHRSFFTISHETYHMFPSWGVIVLALAFGLGVILSVKNVVFWYQHRDRSNHARWPGVHKLDIDQAMKNKIFDELTEEYYKVKKMM